MMIMTRCTSGWLRDPEDSVLMINDVAVRIRAGILLFIPLFMAYTLLHTMNGSPWVVTGTQITDTFDTDAQGRILYQVEAIRRTYEYSLQTKLLWFALFEMFAGMFIWTSLISPTIWVAKALANFRPVEWKPLAPKRFAWTFGAVMVAICLIFFNPDSFASWVNYLTRSDLVPTTYNYMPGWIPNLLVTVCVGFMWMEAVLGVCAGCFLYRIAVKLGWVNEPCDACSKYGQT